MEIVPSSSRIFKEKSQNVRTLRDSVPVLGLSWITGSDVWLDTFKYEDTLSYSLIENWNLYYHCANTES